MSIRVSAARTLLAASLAAAAALGLGQLQVTAQPASPASPEVDAVRKLAWRNIGPTVQTGRVSVVVGMPGDPSVMFVGAAAGGLFKTINGGLTWKPLFEDKDVASIGALAIAPSDPNVLYLGTGEGNPRNSASFGSGVYKSVDAGEHWAHLGLADTEKIARIVVDPRNTDIAYVCALGHEWGPNEERGLFKTRDGGKNWTKVLYRNDLTGCSDVDIDPTNSNIVYAGMYTFRRWAWYFESGGGETAVYKSFDGGDTWSRLSGPDAGRGLPKGPMDRVGVAVARSNPSIVYAISETKDEGVLWRTEDAGETWRMVSRDTNIVFRPFYYADIRVDPQHPNTVYALGGSLYKSEDGGRTFARIGNGTHGDHQSLWIDPLNPNRVLDGDDGGFSVSYDGGRTFDVINNLALTQFYNIDYDMQTPYHLCGGLQDNGTWCGPSQTPGAMGTTRPEWDNVGGGDGFFAVPDLAAPHLVYNNLQGGVLSLTDRRSGASWPINPYPAGIGSSGQWMEPQRYRFNWNAPVVLAPQDPKTIYYGGNVLFKTTNAGQSWDVISPDLTTNDKNKQKSSGGPIVVDNTAAEFHCTILTIAPSPLDPNLVWVGTDDGNVQVTRDAGKTWSSVFANVPGLAPHAWVSRIDASRFDAGTAYVSASHWQDNDYTPYFYRTRDFGRTWTRITNGLPARGWSHVIREDPRNPSLLYGGTENGLYASWDGGARWVSIRNGMPPVPVRDIKIHPRDNDLIVATHGRGLFILDDAAPLQRIGEALKNEAHLFEIRPAIRWTSLGRMFGNNPRDWVAPNPPAGAYINVFLRTAPKEPVTIAITDQGGKTVRTLRDLRAEAGVNRFVWDLRADHPAPPPAPSGRGPGQGGASGTPAEFAGVPPAILAMFGMGSGGPAVLPGEYGVKVQAGGRELTGKVAVSLDPRIAVATADLTAQAEAAQAMMRLGGRVNAMLQRANDVLAQLNALDEQLARQRDRADLQKDVKAAADKLKAWRDADLARPLQGLGYRQYPRLREDVQSLTGGLQRGYRQPTDGEKLRMRELEELADKAAATLNAMLAGEIARINSVAATMPRVSVEPVK